MANNMLSINKSTKIHRLRKTVYRNLNHILLIIIGMFFLLPFLWMLSTSLKSDLDVFRFPPTWLPHDNKRITVNGEVLPLYDVTVDGITHQFALKSIAEGMGTFIDPANPTMVQEIRMKYAQPILVFGLRWQNFVDAMNKATRPGTGVTFGTYLKNSLIITIFSIIGTLFSCTLVAYGFSKIHWPGRNWIFILLLSTMMLPFQVTMIPLYILFTTKLNWGDTFLPLIVPTFFGNPFFIFLLIQFFRTIPEELSDAARVDGASEFQIFTSIILPLSIPVLATITVFTFLGTWNDFTGPLLFLTNPQHFTLALGLQDFQGQHSVAWNLLMAASVVFTIPIIIAFFFAQRTFIQGIKTTDLKE